MAAAGRQLGWSNAGLITDGAESPLVDTLFDLAPTAEMLGGMRGATHSHAHGRGHAH